MGNVKSQNLNFTNKRASVCSDHPAFYHRRRSSTSVQEEIKTIKRVPSATAIPQKSTSMAVNDDEIKSDTDNFDDDDDDKARKMVDGDAYPRPFDHRYYKRPKSYPTVLSAKSLKKPHSPLIPDPSTSAYTNDNDEDDISRRTQMHYLLKHYFRGNFNAPIQQILRQPSSFLFNDQNNNIETKNTNPVRILDICCGSGVWILEMASDYPNVQCYGVNATESYPKMVKPSNAHFLCCDVARNNAKLGFPDNHFDFVRMEMIYKSYNKSQWKILVREIARVLKTGGYFELRDIDPIMKHTGPLGQAFFQQYSEIVKKKMDVDMDWYQHMGNFMEQYGGMIDIHVQEATLPFGWGQGQIPQILLRLIKEALHSHQQDWPEMADVLDGESSTYLDKTKQILDEAIEQHAYYNFYLCWGRKPYFPQTHLSVGPNYESTPMKHDDDSEISALVSGYEE